MKTPYHPERHSPHLHRYERSRLRWRLLSCLVLCLPLVTVDAVEADSERKTRSEELRRVRERMQAVEARMASARGQLSDLERELREVELRMGGLTRQLGATRDALNAKEGALKSLQRRGVSLRSDLVAERSALGREVRAAYMMGRRDYLKVLLNQEDPHTLGRVLTYHGYFNRAHTRRIAEAEEGLARLRTVEAEIASESRALKALEERDRAQSEKLAAERSRRSRLIEALRDDIRGGDQELARLSAAAKELESLLESLQDLFADVPARIEKQRDFNEMKGQLAWPVEGRVRHRFGTSRKGGDLKWSGVVLAAERGVTVRSVHGGRVAFSDWLRGLGLLVIVDHGGGYMSLYGHTSSLLKETGDWVSAGEPIATVGSTGGGELPGLYFEIRRRGQPINPTRWCRARAGNGTAALVRP